MFEIKSSKIEYYDAENRCTHPVDEIANIEGMLFGIVRLNTGKAMLVCRWDKKFTPNGYPVGRRGPCWMSLPESMTSWLLNAIYIGCHTTEEAFAVEEFIGKNFKNYSINLQDSKRTVYVEKGSVNFPAKPRGNKIIRKSERIAEGD